MSDIPLKGSSEIIANKDAIVSEVKGILAKKAQRKSLNNDIKAAYDRLEVHMARPSAKMLEKVMSMNNDQQQDFFTDMIGIEQIIEDLNALVEHDEENEDELEAA